MTALITVYECNNFETLSSASKQYVIALVFFLNQLQYTASVFVIIAVSVDIVTAKCV